MIPSAAPARRRRAGQAWLAVVQQSCFVFVLTTFVSTLEKLLQRVPSHLASLRKDGEDLMKQMGLPTSDYIAMPVLDLSF